MEEEERKRRGRGEEEERKRRGRGEEEERKRKNNEINYINHDINSHLKE
jgi:hypothetical protein